MSRYRFFAAIVIAIGFSATAVPVWAHSMPSEHAPIGVMADHAHDKGEMMLSYRYMNMRMDGLRDGTDDLSDADVRAQGYTMVPQDMNMQMHMLGGMYGITDQVTAMVMVPYTIKDMTVAGMGGMTFDTHSEGLGDIKPSILTKLMDQPAHKMVLQLGVSLPTGSIDERDNTPMGSDQLLPYGMQLGSGTYDPFAAFTYTFLNGPVTYGSQVKGTLRMGENDEDYRLGSMAEINGWAMYDLNKYFALTARLTGKWRGDIHGADDRMNPMMTPAADADHYGYRKIDASFGVNFINHAPGALHDHRLAAEVTVPLYQDLNGPQMKDDYSFTLGWQYAF